MAPKLSYAIKFVADMDRAVKFYRDTLGLTLRYQTPEWTEFSTGETTLALHTASEKQPAGTVELGFNPDDLNTFHKDLSAKGVVFTMPPTKMEFGGSLAQFLDSEGGRCTAGGK